MKLLWLKALRDLRQNISAFLACIAMMGLAIALLVGFSSAYLNLGRSAQLTYQRLQFLDASFYLRDSSPRWVERVRSLACVNQAEGRSGVSLKILLPEGEKVNGWMLGIPVDRPLTVNQLLVQQGSSLRQAKGECLLERRFAQTHGFQVGQRLELEQGPNLIRLRIAGLVCSPEYLWLTPDRLDPRPAARRFGVVFASHADVARLSGTDAIREVHVRWRPGYDPKTSLQEVEKLLAAQRDGPGRDRSEQASHSLLERDRQAFAGIASVFPTALLGLSGLMLFLTLWQLIHQQRKQVGILLCQGLSQWWIVGHYGLLATFVGLASSLLGWSLGPWLAHWATGFYVETLGLPFVSEKLEPAPMLVGGGVALLLAWVASGLALRHLLGLRPLDLLRSEFFASSPLPGWLSRLPIGLSYRWLFPLRNLLRQPWRSLTMVTGVALANALLLMTLAMLDSQRSTLDFLLTSVHRYDLQVDLERASTSSQRPSVEAWPEVERVEEVLRASATLSHEDRTLERGIWGVPRDSRLLRLYDTSLSPLATGPALTLSPLQQRILNLGSGAQVQVIIPNGQPLPPRHSLLVGRPIYEPIQGPPKMELRALQRLYGRTFDCPLEVANILLVKVHPGQISQVRQRLYRDRRIRDVTTLSQIREDIRELLKLAMAYISLMLVCAGLIALTLVYGCTTMNISERRAEVACMMVQGIRQRDLLLLLLVEALYLWGVGLALGIPGGYAAGDWLLSHYQSDLIDLRLRLLPASVFKTALAGLVISLLASWRAMAGLLRIPLGEATRTPD